MEDTSAMEATQDPPAVQDAPAEAAKAVEAEAPVDEEWAGKDVVEDEDEDEENDGLRMASAEPARDNDRDGGEDDDERADISFGSDDEAGPADAARDDGAGAAASASQPLYVTAQPRPRHSRLPSAALQHSPRLRPALVRGLISDEILRTHIWQGRGDQGKGAQPAHYH